MKVFRASPPCIAQPVFNGTKTFKTNLNVLQDKITRWRGIAGLLNSLCCPKEFVCVLFNSEKVENEVKV